VKVLDGSCGTGSATMPSYGRVASFTAWVGPFRTHTEPQWVVVRPEGGVVLTPVEGWFQQRRGGGGSLPRPVVLSSGRRFAFCVGTATGEQDHGGCMQS